ncbi:MAG: hypothetical protein DSY60_02205 [Persephonella sp.]|nr:MAG: hypothetical protein DSY60_02205 [Persephonella sp.]
MRIKVINPLKRKEYKKKLEKIKKIKEEDRVRNTFARDEIDIETGQKRRLIFVLYLNEKNQLKYKTFPYCYKEKLEELGIEIEEN